MLDQQTLDRLWNFEDPALSEAAFPGRPCRSGLQHRRKSRTRHPAGPGHRPAGPLRGGRCAAGFDRRRGRTHRGVRVLLERGRRTELQRPCRHGRARCSNRRPNWGTTSARSSSPWTRCTCWRSRTPPMPKPGPGVPSNTPPLRTTRTPGAGWWRCTTTWAGRCTCRPVHRGAGGVPARRAVGRAGRDTRAAAAGPRSHPGLLSSTWQQTDGSPATTERKEISHDLHRGQVQGQARLVRALARPRGGLHQGHPARSPATSGSTGPAAWRTPTSLSWWRPSRTMPPGTTSTARTSSRPWRTCRRPWPKLPGSSAASSTARAGTGWANSPSDPIDCSVTALLRLRTAVTEQWIR